MVAILICIMLSAVVFGREIIRLKKVTSTDKVIFIATVDCGYGTLLAQTLADAHCKVIGGAIDPMAPSLMQLREQGIYLIKFDGSSNELLREGICRLRLRIGLLFLLPRYINFIYELICFRINNLIYELIHELIYELIYELI